MTDDPAPEQRVIWCYKCRGPRTFVKVYEASTSAGHVADYRCEVCLWMMKVRPGPTE